MTRPQNKRHEYILYILNTYITNSSDNEARKFLKEVRGLLNDYKDENSRYRERIKTLKEIIRLIGDKTND